MSDSTDRYLVICIADGQPAMALQRPPGEMTVEQVLDQFYSTPNILAVYHCRLVGPKKDGS